jgi:hypothetical protein
MERQQEIPQGMTPAAAVQACIDEINQVAYRPPTESKASPALRAILALDPQTQVLVIRGFLDRLRITEEGHWLRVKLGNAEGYQLRPILSRLLQRDLPFALSDLLVFFDKLGSCAHHYPNHYLPVRAILRSVARFIDRKGLPEELRTCLERLREQLAVGHYVPNFGAQPIYAPTAPENGYISSIDDLLGKATPPIAMELAEPWAASAQRDLQALPASSRLIWAALLSHLHSADGSQPTKKWLAQAVALIESLGRDRFRDFLTSWFPLARLNRVDHPPHTDPYAVDQNMLLSETSEALLKGLAWSASLFSEAEVTAALGDLGETCWKKIPNYGPRSKRVGNAVLWALASIGTPAAVAQLLRVKSKLKHGSAKKLANKAMNRVAAASGQTREDMEETALPTYGLDTTGALTRNLGDFACTLRITPGSVTALTITDSAGKVRKAIPAELKNSHSAELQSLRRTQKELQALLGAQRQRFESILRLPDRRWSFAEWRARFVNHPVLSSFARRLIWTFTTDGASVSAIFHDEHFLQSDDSRVEFPARENSRATVRLWHPVAEVPDAVRAWRAFLERHQITQPFKQAHREIYLLTDAERRTANYSNRFAAHILRQHQFNALCAQRGWEYKLQGSWDGGGGLPTLSLPALNLKAEFWVEPILGGEAPTSDQGLALNLSTDQVRFCQLDPGEPLRVEQIHPQVFSEVMRDVDLFIGVCSIGNDPTWSEGGPDNRYGGYWQSFSFGDLSASAQTRRDILSALLPRLAIASQCSLTDKFLRVQGAIRAYKIHLGSSNILMEPNDQYLCIVTDRSPKSDSTSHLYLPFEGDSVLGVILSKAFLLAADSRITDPTIVRQIRNA